MESERLSRPLTAPTLFGTSFFPTMLILRGSPALSQFRLQKLLQDLTAAGLPARAISAEFVHVIEPFRQAPRPARGLEHVETAQGPEPTCGEPVEPVEGLA